jgi:hypothetical protein
MKRKKRDKAKSFRVPLSTDAVALLKQMESIKRSEYVFPGTYSPRWGTSAAHIDGNTVLRVAKQIAYFISPEGMAELAAQEPLSSRPLGEQSMTRKELDAHRHARLKRGGDITVHWFRAAFRTWADEETSIDHDVKEMALAHTIRNETEGRYRRGDLFEKRIGPMQMWADYCSGRSNDEKVIPLRPAATKVIPLIPAAAKAEASAQAGNPRAGRRPIGEVAMSDAERQRRRRAALKAQSAQGSDDPRGEPLSAVELVRRMRERRSAASKAQKLA